MKTLYIALCLSITILAGVITTNAQESFDKKKQINKLFSEIIRTKRQDKPFVLLTPDDLSKFTKEDLQTLVNEADPCATASPITFGQTVNGQLTSSDCRLDDNSYADFYMFSGNMGQQVTILLSSAAFDTYLGLANDTGTFVLEDDDGGGGTNSRIAATLPASGLYIIMANSTFANQFGNYTLSLNAAPSCTYSLDPTSAEVPAAGGTFTFAVNTQAGCTWSAIVDSSSVYFIRTSGGGTGSGIVTYTVDPNGSTSRTGTIRVGGQVFTITQPPLICTSYSISPTGMTVPSAYSENSFTINAQPGCPWSAQSNNYFLSTNSYGRGDGTVTFTVSNNNGADRTGTITVAGLTFTVTQPGLNCTYSYTPSNTYFNRAANQIGTIAVTTQQGCTWTSYQTGGWITFLTGSGMGSGTLTYQLYGNLSGTRTATIYASTATGYVPINITQTGYFMGKPFDYDNDGWADISVWRPSNRVWYGKYSLYGINGAMQFGLSDDLIVPADYDGDGRTEFAVYRPSTGVWYWMNSSNNATSAVAFGTGDDIPVPADYDGDGKADIAIYRPSTGTWWIFQSNSNSLLVQQFGIAEDKPTRGDFDGDRKADIAVFRPSTGVWYRLNSSNGSFYAVNFGLSDDKPTPADYDGDGKTDISVFRPSNGVWYRFNSSDGSYVGIQFGIAEDLPVAADYDGDGKSDLAVYRPSTNVWYLQRSTLGFMAMQYGMDGDKPVPNAFVR